MQPWFIATGTFTPRGGEAWRKYVSWSGLGHLDEVVSLDPMLCPTVLPRIKDEYWPHIVDEDFMLGFFVDLETSHARALQVQSDLRAKHPEERHANCHVWAISRAVAA